VVANAARGNASVVAVSAFQTRIATGDRPFVHIVRPSWMPSQQLPAPNSDRFRSIADSALPHARASRGMRQARCRDPTTELAEGSRRSRCE